jgi:hypothetical protein
MRFELIGFGAWGRFQAEATRQAPGASLVAIACGGAVSAETANRTDPRDPVYADWRCRLADDAVDAVAAFRQGRSVVSAAEARGRIVACLEAKRSPRAGRPIALAPS